VCVYVYVCMYIVYMYTHKRTLSHLTALQSSSRVPNIRTLTRSSFIPMMYICMYIYIYIHTYITDNFAVKQPHIQHQNPHIHITSTHTHQPYLPRPYTYINTTHIHMHTQSLRHIYTHKTPHQQLSTPRSVYQTQEPSRTHHPYPPQPHADTQTLQLPRTPPAR
jgi:hypothetical protein